VAASLQVSGRNPDQIIVRDKGLVKHLKGDDLLIEPSKRIDKWTFAVTSLPKLIKKLKSWDGELPNWLDTSVNEAKWAAGKAWKGERVAWLFGKDRMAIQAPYSLTLTDSIGEMDSAYYFSHLIKGWIVKIADNDIEYIQEVLGDYDIAPSSDLKAYLDGRGSWRSTLTETVAEAAEKGIVPREDFPSGRSYRWWQKESVPAMAYQGSTQLADQVGLGKGGSFTGGMLSLDDYLTKLTGKPGQVYPAIFSVTKSMKDEIAAEIHKWDPKVRIQIVSGTKRDPLLTEDADVFIFNHDILGKRLEDILEAEPRSFVADECHAFKNEGAVRTKAAIEVANAVRANTDHPYIVMASGTPFTNGPIELWPLLIIQGLEQRFGEYAKRKLGTDQVQMWVRGRKITTKLSDKRAFEIYFCGGHYDKYKKWHAEGSTHVTELNKMLIANGMIRRRKSDVMSPMPELQEHLAKIDPGQDFLDEYAEKEEEFRTWAMEQASIVAMEQEISVNEARRIIAAKLENGEGMMRLTELRKTLAFGKIPGTIEWISGFMDGTLEIKHFDGHIGPVSDDPTRRKLIVFVHHQEPRRALVEHPALAQYGTVTILSGSEQDGDSIQEAKRLFQEDDDTRLIICSMAAREGHTLTAAKDVYLMELPFVPAWVVQMAGRCWARLSEQFEPHEAMVHYSIIEHTEDARSIKRLKRKKISFDAVVDAEGTDEDIKNIETEDIAEFLADLDIGDAKLTIAR